MSEEQNNATAELLQLRELETEIISLYFSTVSNYSKLNKNLMKKGGIDDPSLKNNYTNILDLQLQLFEKNLEDFNSAENIEEYKEKTRVLLDMLQEANQ